MGSALAALTIVPIRGTIGTKLMKLMGWRDNQGIGPRSKKIDPGK